MFMHDCSLVFTFHVFILFGNPRICITVHVCDTAINHVNAHVSEMTSS